MFFFSFYYFQCFLKVLLCFLFNLVFHFISATFWNSIILVSYCNSHVSFNIYSCMMLRKCAVWHYRHWCRSTRTYFGKEIEKRKKKKWRKKPKFTIKRQVKQEINNSRRHNKGEQIIIRQRGKCIEIKESDSLHND